MPRGVNRYVTTVKDLVMWDSHPLQLGATPIQVFIDGIAQLEHPVHIEKGMAFQSPPHTPDFDKETSQTIKYEGLPPLTAEQTVRDKTVIFTNVSNVWTRAAAGLQETFTASGDEAGVAVVKHGKVVCVGGSRSCSSLLAEVDAVHINLRGGALSPGLLSYGTNLGLQEIAAEASTADGVVYDAFYGKIPQLIGGHHAAIRAVDGLQFSTRDAL